jgi:methyl-accepting chemotaxis protein
VSLLIVLSLLIMGLGLYGMSEFAGATGNYIRLIDRALALADLDQTAQKLSIAEKDLIIETDEEALKAMAERDDFKKAPDSAAKAMEEIGNTVNQDSPQWAREMPQRLADATKAFIDSTRVVSGLALRNTAQKARDVLAANSAIWAGYTGAVGKVEPDVAKRMEAGEADAAFEMVTLLQLRASRLSFQREVRSLLTTNRQAERDELAGIIRQELDDMDKCAKNAPAVYARHPESGQILAGLARQIEQLRASAEKIVDLANQDSNGRAFAYSVTTVREARERLNGLIRDYTLRSNRQLEEAGAGTRALQQSLFWFIIVSGAIGIAAASVIAFVVVSGVTGSLNRIIEALDGGAEEVAAAAGEISNSSQALAEGATEQAASLEETSSALEQMASMTRQNADNARRTGESTADTVRLIGEGSVAVRNMSAAMAEISESAEQIGRIIKTIEDIAFQTNLLALNAAVEAARAGESGKGFAVVADEVRNLAQRSAQAARDTTALIEGTVARVHNGSGIAARLDASFREIQDGATKVGELIGEINTATNEQAQGVDQVNTAVAQMDKVTQRNAASAEESASSSEELSAQADSLKGLVEDLVAIVSGTGGKPSGRSPAPAPARRQPHAAGGNKPRKSLPFSSRPASGNGKKVMKPDEVIPLDNDLGDL